ncbi:MAG: hypothetical protein PVG65_01600 [Candidatus Thorarchaeota archaeon]
MNKRGIMQIPFGMIFSIIIIIAILGVAIFAIVKFVGVYKCVNTGMFKENLQSSVNNAWSGTGEYSDEFPRQGGFPSGIDYVCFIDTSSEERGAYEDFYMEFERFWNEDANIFFYPLTKACEGQASYYIEHLNITKITEKQNPYCVSATEKIKIKKGFYDILVEIE